jgi:hypothetical protein
MTLHKPANAQPVLVLLVMLFVPAAASAQAAPENLWDRLHGMMAQEGAQLEQALQEQSEMDTQEAALQEQLEQGRRLRAMYREAVLLSELNVAWIYDQLDHWDCRLAEQKVREVETRIEELTDFGGRLDSLCSGLGPEAGRQQEVCARERSALAQSATALDDLGRRYALSCPGTGE